MDVVNLAEKFTRFTDRWSPKIVGDVSGRNTGNVVNERTVADLGRV